MADQAELDRASTPVAQTPGEIVDFGSFKARFERANALAETGRAGEAEPVYLQLLAEDPASAALYCKLAAVTAELGRLDQATELYDRAAELDPQFPWPHVGRAEVLEARGEFTEALTALARAQELDPTIDVLVRRIEAMERKAAWQAEARDGPQIRTWPASGDRGAAPAGPRVRVVSWDLAHNPLGRAWVLAELAARRGPCEVVGPIFPAYGEDLWGPLRESERAVEVRGYRAPTFAAFVEGAIRLVEADPCDIAWVAKPRFPGLLIGLLYKLIHGARVIVDVDDNELAFVKAEGPLELDAFTAGAQPSDWQEPFNTRWTQLAQSMIGWTDAVTVCNPVLRDRHGGTLVRHARDAGVFAEAVPRRDEIRAAFGLAPSDKVVLFLGTPRRHKGVLRIAEALDRLGDPDVVFCVIGSIPEERLRQELEEFANLRVALHPDQPLSRVAEINVMADLVCILQDPDDPIAQSQTPAKLTDALAAGTAVLATAVPPIADLARSELVRTVGADDFEAALRETLSGPAADPDRAKARRRLFQEVLSFEAADEAVGAAFDAAQENLPVSPKSFLRLLRHIDDEMPGSLSPTDPQALRRLVGAGPRAGALRRVDRGVNLVFFWKQNDSGLYGRRQDMLADRLSRSPRVKRILHIDAPICVDQLNVLGAGRPGGATNQDSQVLANTVSRFLRTRDAAPLHRRSFVYRGRESMLLGRELPYRESFPNAVEAWMRELDMTDNAMAWVCPVVPMFAEVQARMGFSFVFADVIDDERQWPMRPQRRAYIEAGYRDTFAVTTASAANCEPVADWLRGEGLDVRLVPNGMDSARDVDGWPTPAALAGLPRPIIGYAGNLNDRIDWPLIAAVADRRPQWSIVLIGSAPANEAFAEVAARPNVHALGVVPYAAAREHIAAFDVAMIPHATTALSERMNPLKLYVYRGLGLPVVSTPTPNLDDLERDIRIAATPDAFVAAVEEALDERRISGRIYPDAALTRSLSWESREAAIWAQIEVALDRRGEQGA